ncbi:nucleoside phosphorylase, putative, partial [Trypanosoma cruzi]
ETSAVCFLSHLLGYQAGSMCVVVAKRAGAEHLFTTSEQSGQALKNAIHIALEAIVAVG